MSIKIFSRGKGASAVQKAAYRAGEVIMSDYDGEKYDYTRKSGIIHKDILLPKNAPFDYKDRSVMWNAVEKSERFVNAQLAREIEISLPVEFTREQNITLARKFAKEVLVAGGMCVDICIHDNGSGNPHAHLMCSVRPIEEDGSWGQKSYSVNGKKVPTVDWNEREKSEYWRSKWAKYQNEAQEEHGFTVRVDHRSFYRQGKEQLPAVHLGPAAHMENRGIRTEQGDRNRRINEWNRELRMIKGRIKKLKTWLYEQPLEDAPSMSDVLKSITANNRLKSRAQRLQDIKTLANVINFCKEYNISSIEAFADSVNELQQEQYDVASTIKKQDRRLQTLDIHLQNVDIYNRTKSVYKRYAGLDPKQQEKFRQQNAVAIRQHEAAHKYIKDHLNGQTVIPEKAWRKERNQIIQNRYALAERYYALKTAVKSSEVIRRNADKIISDVKFTQDLPRKLAHDMEL